MPDEKIQKLLEAASLAPSGSNLQPWRYVIVKSEEVKKKLTTATPLTFVTKAPVILACCVDNMAFSGENVALRVRELKEAGAFSETSLEDFDLEDYSRRRDSDQVAARAYLALNAAIAIDHITLRAVDLGLGTCWIMMFNQEKVKNVLEIDDRYSVIALLPVGYPDQNPPPRPRLCVQEISFKEM